MANLEFVYEREVAPCGVAVEMIYGAEDKSAKVWKLFAMQIFSEADGDYREIEHYENGAPLLDCIPQRISLSHTPHFLAVATLPKTPDIALDETNVRTAMGIDLEKGDRRQVIKIREKFLSEEEKTLLPDANDAEKATEDDIRQYILAWTCKEAMYKANMGESADWKEDYKILKMPEIAQSLADATEEKQGEGEILISGKQTRVHLSSWEKEGHIITLAFSDKIARFSC